MYFEKLTIKNYRCFAEQQISFNRPSFANPEGPRLPNVNLLIGNNGTGKTTLFQALTMVALRSYLADNTSGFRTPRVVRYNAVSANANATLLLSPMDTGNTEHTDDYAFTRVQVRSTVRRKGSVQSLDRGNDKPTTWTENLFNESHPACFIAAYGASRRTEPPETYAARDLGIRYRRVASLFEPHVGLMPLSLAYERCQKWDRWNEVIAILNGLLQAPIQLTSDRDELGEPLFNYDGIPLPISELSDGYRLFAGWLIDCLAHLANILPKRLKLTEAAGIVIVDEVDLFLSPVWQHTVLESLSATFPRIQWFCSTHSALVAGSLEDDNIYILERSAPFTTRVRLPNDAFEGKSVDEVLVALFDVQQPRSPQLQRQLSELAERAMNGDLEASLLYLRRLNEGSGQLR